VGDMSLKSICDKFISRTEKLILQKALEATKWNRKKAAELLNISYKSMLNKMKIYEIV
jgi:transcriptional regulator with PAS, ATPase and Fis domain